jgi:hypothetical protein
VAGYTANLFLPFPLRRFKMRLPPQEACLFKNPCVLFLFFFFG